MNKRLFDVRSESIEFLGDKYLLKLFSQNLRFSLCTEQENTSITVLTGFKSELYHRIGKSTLVKFNTFHLKIRYSKIYNLTCNNI